MFHLVTAGNLLVLDCSDVVWKHRCLVAFDDRKLHDILFLTRANLALTERTRVLNQLVLAKRKLVGHAPVLRACGDTVLAISGCEWNQVDIVLIDTFLFLVRLLDLGLFRGLGLVARIVFRWKPGLVVSRENDNLFVLVAALGIDRTVKRG